MAIQPSQPQSIGGVLDTTFQLYKASLVKVMPLCLLLAIASTPSSIYMLTHSGANPADPLGAIAAMKSVNYWLSYVIGVVASLWMIGALYLRIHAIGSDEELGIGAALQRALARVPVLFVMMILFIIATALGFVLLIVPGLILTISLMLCFNLMLFEGKGPVESLSGSHRLVWGHWWRTAVILTVGFIILVVMYMVAGLVIGVVMPLVGVGQEDAILFSVATGLLVGVLMSLLVTPFYIGLAIAVYWDLKLRKEGGDLAARVGALNPA